MGECSLLIGKSSHLAAVRDNLYFMKSLSFVLFVAVGSVAAEPAIDFNRDVRPILSDKCFACHGPDEKHRAAKLRLDVEKDAKADRDGTACLAGGTYAQ